MGDHRRTPTAQRSGTLTGRELTALDPSFGHGLALLESIVATDGELSAADKAVLAVAMAAVSDPAGCTDEAERALGCGVSADSLRALALALYLSRGEPPARIVLAAAGAVPPTVDRPPPIEAVDIDTVLAEFASVFDALPARVTLLAEHAPSGLEAYHRMRVAVLRDGRLPPQLAELALFAVNAAAHREDYAAVHARGARRAGATTAQLVEAGLCTIRYGGVAAWLAASEAIDNTEETT